MWHMLRVWQLRIFGYCILHRKMLLLLATFWIFIHLQVQPVDPAIFNRVTHECDEASAKFCLNSANGAKTACFPNTNLGEPANGTHCDCANFDQNATIDATLQQALCYIQAGGYCSDDVFGEQGRPKSACTLGTICIFNIPINFFKPDKDEKLGICCPNLVSNVEYCDEAFTSFKFAKLGSDCNPDDFKSILLDSNGMVVQNNGLLNLEKFSKDKFRAEFLRKMLKSAAQPNMMCFSTSSVNPSDSEPVLPLRCNDETHRCDCGYSQVYKSMTDDEREYYDSNGHWVIVPEPSAWPLAFDTVSNSCRLQVGSNCTNFGGRITKDFESCASYLKCCPTFYYDDYDKVNQDIIGRCAEQCLDPKWYKHAILLDKSSSSRLKRAYAIICISFLCYFILYYLFVHGTNQTL